MQLETQDSINYLFSHLINTKSVFDQDINLDVKTYYNDIAISINGITNHFPKSENGLKNAITFMEQEAQKYKESLFKFISVINGLNQKNYNALSIDPLMITNTLEHPTDFKLHLYSLHAEKVVGESEPIDMITARGIEQHSLPIFKLQPLFDEKIYTINVRSMTSKELDEIVTEMLERTIILEQTPEINMAEKPNNMMSEVQIQDSKLKKIFDKTETWLENKDIFKDDEINKNMTDKEIFEKITKDFHEYFSNLEINLKIDDPLLD